MVKCPSIDGSKILSPNFLHLKKLHEIEKGKGTKIAYKITEKVLHPQSIEKTSVKLADSAFHERTINALIYYSKHGYDNFEETAHFLRNIRNCFNKINVKSADYGIRSRDDNRNLLSVENRSKMMLLAYQIYVRTSNLPDIKCEKGHNRLTTIGRVVDHNRSSCIYHLQY